MINVDNKIAILIAVKNAGLDLEKTISSLISQTSKNYNVYLYNGGDEKDVENTLKNNNFVPKVFKTWSDSGLANAWNRGLNEISEDWVLLLNAGDLLHSTFVEGIIKVIKSENKNHILMADVSVFSHGNIIKTIYAEPPKIKSFIKGSVGFAHPGMIASKYIYNKIGLFNENLKIGFDSEWILRAWINECVFVRHDMKAYMEKGGMSDKYFNIGIKEFFDSIRYLKIEINEYYCKIAPLLFIIIRPFIKIYNNIFKDYIRSLKHYLIAIVNFSLKLIPFSYFRNAYLKIMKFKIGENVSFGVGFKFYMLGNVFIGNNVVINRNLLLDNRAEIFIGNNVSIARDCAIFTGGHDIKSPFLEMTKSKVIINENVFIFSNCLIMPGVNIGKNSIVYPGSVVTKNIEDNSIVAGNPAKCIRKNLIQTYYINNYNYPYAM